MMGIHDAQPELFSYRVDLDKRVHARHPLRRVLASIDFTFAREVVAPTYGDNGNVSLDPAVVLKLMFLLFQENVRSERELMRRLPERLDWLWFLGYGLDDAIPDHGVLSKARKRWGGELFETLFVCTVRQCVEAGLVDGSKVHLDGSLIDADASRDSVVKADATTIAHIKAAYASQERKLDETTPPSARTDSKLGHSIARQWKEETLEFARAISRLPEAYADRARRRHLMEGSFARRANLHHFKRARWRRLWRQQIQDHLIAAVQDIAILAGAVSTGVGARLPRRPTAGPNRVGAAFLPGLRALCRPCSWPYALLADETGACLAA